MRMFKRKFTKLFIMLGVIFLNFLTFSCTNQNSYKNSEYNAVLVAQPIGFSSCITNFKVEIKNNKLNIDNEEVGTLSNGKISQDNWMNSSDYEVFQNVELVDLMNIEKCFVIESTTDINGADCFYLIANANNHYLLFASKSENYIGIFKVYLLNEI